MNALYKRTELKIILLGDSRVGKTALANRYNEKDFKESSQHTLGIEFINKKLCIENKQVYLQIWDTAGMERFQSITEGFYRNTNCCVLVYDVNILESFNSLDKWHAEFIKANPITPDEKFPFVLVGNKTDVKGGKSRVVEKEKAVEWCDSKGGMVYFETSAKEKTNVDEAFLEIVLKALSHVHSNNKIYKSDNEIGEVIDLSTKKEGEVQARSCAC